MRGRKVWRSGLLVTIGVVTSRSPNVTWTRVSRLRAAKRSARNAFVSCRGWLAGGLAAWLAGWLAGWVAGWLAGWLVFPMFFEEVMIEIQSSPWLAGWLGGWLACFPYVF